MTLAVLRKNQPAPDGFFDMEQPRDERRATFATMRVRHTAARSGQTVDRMDYTLTQATGVYALSLADARDANAALDMPEQPLYDWSDVAEDE